MEGSTVVEPVHGLARNALGLPQVLFCIVTGAAPIAAMLFNDFWAVYGGGWSAPSAFMMATVAFTVFSVGYVAMARRVTAAGGFYSFTSHAFGQSVGMGVALLIAACYTIFSAGVTGVTAYFANATFNDWFSVDIPVWVWEFGTIGIMVTLAFFHIELTAKILGVFLIIEVAALLVFAFLTLFQPQDGLVLESLLPWNFFDSSGNGSEAAFGAGTVGAGLFGAFWSWIGFEMAPNYAEESRDPKAIMGPATYISVIGLGVLYTFVTWMLVVAYGKAGIIPGINAQLEGNVASVFYPATDRALDQITIGDASALTRAFELTIVTGSFACQLAFFNTATRYSSSMGREGVLPRALGRTHPPHHSPYVAITLVGVLCALVVAGFLWYNSSALGALLYLGTWVPMMGNIGILSVMAVVSVAIIKYFATTAKDEQKPWNTIIAPVLATVMMVVLVYLLINNRTTLAGGVTTIPFVNWMWLPPLLVFIAGILLAQYYRSSDRARYDGIGRYLHEDA
jgi:amino acid transporter